MPKSIYAEFIKKCCGKSQGKIEKEKDFDILITDLNDKVRNRKINVKNSVGYLVGIYQKKGVLPLKNNN